MVVRVWHGWTRADDADGYEKLLRETVLPGIAARGIEGYLGSEVFRRVGPSEVEFKTVLWFASREAAAAFGGNEGAGAYIPDEAKAFLTRYREEARHYEVRQARD